MAKKYIITQKINLNGNIKSVSFQAFLDEADLILLLAQLEGGYEVKEVNLTLSDMTKADTLVATANPVSVISMVGPKKQYESIRPFSGSIYFKETTTVDDITNILLASKPFEHLATEKPLRVSVKRNESRV
jgi:hypothetical protein